MPEPLRTNDPANDLGHIRVGPRFLSKVEGVCPECGQTTFDRECHIVENQRSKKKLAIHADACLEKHPELVARMGVRAKADLGSFLGS